MKTQPVHSSITRSLLAAAAFGILLFAFAAQSFGQREQAERSTTLDGLAATGFMTNPTISDDLDGTDDEYFYKFQAKPGRLTLTLEVTANETNAGATLDLFGANSKTILSNMLVQAANGGSERESKSVNLAKAQDITIRIKGLKYGSGAGYPGVYKILLEGTAVNFKTETPSDAPVEIKTPDGAVADSPVEVKKPTEALVEKAGQNTISPAPQSAGMDPDKRLEEVTSDKTDQNKKPDVPPLDGAGPDKKIAVPSDKAGQNKKPDAVDRAIEKGKAKSNKLLELLNRVKEKIPD